MIRPRRVGFSEDGGLFPARPSPDEGRTICQGGKVSDRVPPRPDAPSGPRLPPPPTRHVPPATWRPIEAIPVFLIALIGGALLGAPVALSSASCSATFVLEELFGELAFVGAVVLWV